MRLTICKAIYGSRPWFAVPEGANHSHLDAVWLVGTGPTVLETTLGPVATDGNLRFCASKGELMSAITRSGHTAAWRTLHTK